MISTWGIRGCTRGGAEETSRGGRRRRVFHTSSVVAKRRLASRTGATGERTEVFLQLARKVWPQREVAKRLQMDDAEDLVDCCLRENSKDAKTNWVDCRRLGCERRSLPSDTKSPPPPPTPSCLARTLTLLWEHRPHAETHGLLRSRDFFLETASGRSSIKSQLSRYDVCTPLCDEEEYHDRLFNARIR